ncbi:MAG TPA: ATP-binding protein [Spirochaetia bacterium]|nr:ATP-binding protein [Spirochaetia bacterium]
MKPGQGLDASGRKTARVQISVSPSADFREIMRELDMITLPPTRVSHHNIRYAILELLNNSIRAHKERGETREISVIVSLADGWLNVSIRDYGGGFDPRKLPYDLTADPQTLDLHSAPFEEYQRKNGYKRFGMGIYVAKKTFDRFTVAFLDEHERPLEWQAGKVTGTLITFSTPAEAADGK